MKKSIMDILVCPKCKNDLILNVRKEDKEEIIEGELKCNNCSNYKHKYIFMCFYLFFRSK